MDMLRLILPSLLSLVFGLIALWTITYYVKKNVDAESKPYISKTAWILTVVAIIGFAFYVIQIASVNEIEN